MLKSFLIGKVKSGRTPLFHTEVPLSKGKTGLVGEVKAELTEHLIEDGGSLPNGDGGVQIEICEVKRFFGFPISVVSIGSERI